MKNNGKALDKKFRVPRAWSNRELENIGHLFSGKIVNVSGWKDIDKEGRRYKDYFPEASEYWITNYKAEARGFQGNLENEIYLDLTTKLPNELSEIFNVVLSHTVLEHIFECKHAFENLCRMSNDIVIVVVPFLQEKHTDYGDYWRFTPEAIDKLFQVNGLETIYINANDVDDSSIYVFAVGSKLGEKWDVIKARTGNMLEQVRSREYSLGRNIIVNRKLKKIWPRVLTYFGYPR